VIFHRLGPYHLARLEAAGKLMPLVALETSCVDGTYAWDFVGGSSGFERSTLFPEVDALKQSKCEVVRRVARALDRIEPDVVAIPGWADAAALGALDWCRRNAVASVMMSESTEWDEARHSCRETAKRRVVGLCAAALVGGRPHKNYVVKLGMPAERVFLGYDAVDNTYFAKNTEKLTIETLKCSTREKYRLPENYFLASARFVEKKNLPKLIQAYALYRKKVERGRQKTEMWDLVLLGDGELRSSILNLRRSLGLETRVHLPGFKQYPDLPAYYGLASAFVHASTTEQWGLVVNEAMASGLPVLVSSRCGCAEELVEEGVNGFTFAPYDTEQLAQLMLRIWAMEPGARIKMGGVSRRIIADWGPERFASGLKAAAEKAAETSPKRAGVVDWLLLRALLAR
jgi:glycosyltransferase involved in cell wall biosynthesis